MVAPGLSQIEAAAVNELVERRKLAVNIFRPQQHQEPIFEQPRPKFCLVGGGNRGGKTITLTELVAAIALDLPITFEDGTQRDARMPWQKGKPIEIWLVCIDQRHIGEVLYPALFKAGHFERFKVVHDPDTKQLRAYDYIKDKGKGLKPKPHPPFIPKRYVPDGAFSWESKSDRIFNRVTITDPTSGDVLAEIFAFTSKSDPPQGRSISLCWCDEQLARSGYIDELKARLVDKDGQLVWSSWNDEDSDDLNAFSSMLDREIKAGSGLAKRVDLSMSGNTSLDPKTVADFLSGCATDEERMQRDYGIAPSEKLRMYPLYAKGKQSVKAHQDRLAIALQTSDGIPPNEWTKVLILDPGTQHPAVLLCATPPPEFGDYQVLYQEIYPGRADPKTLAKLVRKETEGQIFYRWICDWHAGRQVTMGSDAHTRVVDAYAKAFKEEGLSCVATGSQFMFGSDNVGGRQLVLQGWMHPNKDGIPKLRIVEHRCPQLCEQLQKIKKRIVNKEIVDDRKVAGMASDLVDAAEYYAASGPRYIFLTPRIEDAPSGYQRYMKRFGAKEGAKEPIKIGTYY